MFRNETENVVSSETIIQVKIFRQSKQHLLAEYIDIFKSFSVAQIFPPKYFTIICILI